VSRGLLITLGLVIAAVGLAGAPHGATADAVPGWRLEQPPAPSGSPFVAPLGPPGDLAFMAPNRVLLAVQGNATVPPGLFAYDGQGWHQLSTVCGGAARNTRIAVAGPHEFWTLTVPSVGPTRDTGANGTALCHFKDGAVVASYSTAISAVDPYREMDAAACNGPDDCWFGGFGDKDPTGERRGSFHLHWNGSTLESVYAPQGRGVTDIRALGSSFFETTVVGRAPNDTTSTVDLAQPESEPHLIHRIAGQNFTNDPFLSANSYLLPAPSPFLPPTTVAIPTGGSELLALDGDGQQLWASGGGAASGPAVPNGADVVSRPPLLVHLVGNAWQEVPIASDAFGLTDRFVDVAAVPGTEAAWVAVERFRTSGDPTGRATVAQVASDGSVSATTLPASGPGRGTAAKIAFTELDDGWMVTSQGWVFHYTDGSALPRDTDPAFAGTITFRPNEAAEQFVPDAPPVDDSELFKPPPVQLEQPPAPGSVKRLPSLLKRVRSKLRGRTLMVSFTLTRTARVALTGRRKGKVVVRTKPRLLRPGRHVLRLRLDRRRWPQRLSFSVREPGAAPPSDGGTGGDSGDTVTTGGDTVATRNG
jgi:hypothetical protein